MTENPPALLTPAEVARFLMGLSRRLDDLVDEYRKLGEAAAEAKRVAEREEASAFLQAEGTVDTRKRMAILSSSDQRFAADIAERRLLACREAIRATQIRIDVGRTLSATSREEMRGFGGGGP